MTRQEFLELVLLAIVVLFVGALTIWVRVGGDHRAAVLQHNPEPPKDQPYEQPSDL